MPDDDAKGAQLLKNAATEATEAEAAEVPQDENHAEASAPDEILFKAVNDLMRLEGTALRDAVSELTCERVNELIELCQYHNLYKDYCEFVINEIGDPEAEWQFGDISGDAAEAFSLQG